MVPTPTANDARSDLAELLAETVYQAMGLKESLVEERKALEKQDLEAIDEAVECKLRCVDELRLLDAKRDTLVRSLGFESGQSQLRQVIDWCDEEDEIGNRWDQLMIIAAESSALNMTNGAIIRVRQQQFESSLAVLRGSAPGSDTYSRSGAESGNYSRRSIAEA